MAAIILDRFLPQSSFFAIPECIQARSEEDLLIGRVAQCLLALHRRSKEATLSPSSASLALISDTASKVRVAYANMAKRGGAAAAPLSPTSQLAAWLLCLEDRSLTAASLVKRFHSLSTDIQNFLAESVAKTLKSSAPSDGRAKIEEDPSILLRIRNEKGENLVEEALETLHKQEIYAPLLSELKELQTYEPTADKDLLTRVTESPLFYMLCYFVWWEDGGKDNSCFGSLTHGEDRIRADPKILWETQDGSSRLKRLQEEIESQTGFRARAREEKELPLVNDQLDKRFCEELVSTCPTAIENNIPQIRLEIFRRLRKKPFPTDYAQLKALFPPLDDKELVEMVKILAERNPEKVSKNLDAYRIKGSTELSDRDKFRALVEIAKITVAQEYVETSAYIAKYEIATFKGISQRERFDALVEIFKIAADNQCDFCYKPDWMSPFTEIPQEEKFQASVDILKLAAAKNRHNISAQIHHYGIATFEGILPQKRLQALVDIAMNAATHDGRAVSEHIANYGIATLAGITPQERLQALVDIAMSAATENGSATSKHIAKYGIATLAGITPQKKLEVLVSIAMRAATENGQGTSFYIANYGIATLEGITPQERLQALVDIAMSAATENGSATSEHIANYGIATLEGITPQERFEALVDIAMSAVKIHGASVCEYLESYNFDSFVEISPEERSKARLEVAKIAIMHPILDFPSIGRAIYGMSESDAYYARTLLCMRAGAEEGFTLRDTSRLPDLSELEKFYSETSPILKQLSKEAEEFTATVPPEVKEYLYNCHRMHVAMATLLMLSLKEPHRSDTATKASLEKSLLQILKYHNTPMQIYLTFLLTELCSDDSSLYLELVSGLTGNEEVLCLLQISIATLAQQAGKSKEEIKAIREKFSHPKTFKYSSHLANALNMLQSLHSCTSLSPLQKYKLLERLCSHDLPLEEFSPKKFRKEISQLYVLIELRISQKGWPKDLPQEFTAKDVEDAFMSCIKTDLFGGIELTPEETRLIEESYCDLTENMRRPFGLEIYAARISTLDDPPLMEAFKRFVISLLKKTYREERYKTEGNPHLERMSKEYPAVWNAWQSLPTPPLKEKMMSPSASGGGGGGAAGGAEGERAAPFSFFNEFKTKLITDKHLPAFETICPRLFAFLSKETPPAKGGDSDEEKIEDLCMELCQAALSPQETLAKVKKLKGLVSKTKLFKGSQWENDIIGLYRTLSTKKQPASACIMITDDWQDMFLSGTEVSGNCQRIDGSPGWNQCLVSECLDGKMQYVSIADLATDKILANAQLKLLFIHTRSAEGTLLLEPAVFMERIYPSIVSEEYKAALYTRAKARAASLGLKLYEAKPFDETAREVYTLESLGSSAPYEYEDGGEGITEGTYAIEGVLVS